LEKTCIALISTKFCYFFDKVTKTFGVAVRDFGQSWRDGNAFLAIVNSLKPG